MCHRSRILRTLSGRLASYRVVSVISWFMKCFRTFPSIIPRRLSSKVPCTYLAPRLQLLRIRRALTLWVHVDDQERKKMVIPRLVMYLSKCLYQVYFAKRHCVWFKPDSQSRDGSKSLSRGSNPLVGSLQLGDNGLGAGNLRCC